MAECSAIIAAVVFPLPLGEGWGEGAKLSE